MKLLQKGLSWQTTQTRRVIKIKRKVVKSNNKTVQQGAYYLDKRTKGVRTLATADSSDVFKISDFPQEQQAAHLSKLKRFLRSPYDLEILKLLAPTLAMMMLDPLMSLADVAIIARLGTKQLAGVGMGGIQVVFISFLFSFLNVLTTPQVAKVYVDNDKQQFSKVVGRGMWIAAVAGLCLIPLVYFIAPLYTTWMKAETEVGLYAMQYMQARAFGIPFMLLSYVFTGTFRGCQDTISPLIAEIFAIVVNLVCDIVFVFGFGWGVAGSAWATTLSYTVSSLWLLRILFVQKGLQLKQILVPPKIKEVIELLVQGAALSTRTLSYMAFVTVSTMVVAHIGPAAQAAQEIVRQVYIFFSVPLWALNSTTISILSKYLGSKQYAKAKEVFNRLISISLVGSIILGITQLILQNFIAGQFTSEAAVLSFIGSGLMVVGCLMWTDAIAGVVEGTLAANEQATVLASVSVVGVCTATLIIWALDRLNLVTIGWIWFVIRLNSLLRIGFGWGQLFFNQYDKLMPKVTGLTTINNVTFHGGAVLASTDEVHMNNVSIVNTKRGVIIEDVQNIRASPSQ